MMPPRFFFFAPYAIDFLRHDIFRAMLRLRYADAAY